MKKPFHPKSIAYGMVLFFFGSAIFFGGIFSTYNNTGLTVFGGILAVLGLLCIFCFKD